MTQCVIYDERNQCTGGMTGRAAIDKEKTMAEFTIPKRMTSFVEDTTHTVTAVPHKLIDASRGALCTTREEAEHLMERGEDLFEKLVERGQEIEIMQTEPLHRLVEGLGKAQP
jgi:hypothetical protein